MVEVKEKPQGLLHTELRGVYELTIYVCSIIASSLLIAFLLIGGVFGLELLSKWLFGTTPFIVEALLDFAGIEVLVVFIIMLIVHIYAIPRFAKRQSDAQKKSESDIG